MAYDATKNRQNEESPYAALTREPSNMADTGPAMPSAAPLPGAAEGPNTTGHVNFDQVYNANAGVAAREAGKLQTSAWQKGSAAQGGITGAQNTFNLSARTGTITGPTQAQRDWAKTGATGVTKAIDPSNPSAAGSINPSTPGGSPDARAANAPPQPVLGGSIDSRSANAQRQQATAVTRDQPTEQSVRAAAAGGYTGPRALSDLEQYSKLAQDAAAAQDETTALGSGNDGIKAVLGGGGSKLDAALLGAAGRHGFEDLGNQFGGLKQQLADANTASQGVGNAARQQTEDAVKQYQALAGEFDGRTAADQGAVTANEQDIAARQAAATPKKRDDPNADPGISSIEEEEGIWKDMGIESNEGRMTNSADAAAWGKMTPDEWRMLSGMTAAERKAWWEQRKSGKGPK